MTPKEKADDLVKKFTEPTQQWDEIEREWCDDLELSKQCALIAVDEIIDCTHSHDIVESAILKGNSDKYCYEYWQQVKEEINKL